jgi:hypothetical protein
VELLRARYDYAIAEVASIHARIGWAEGFLVKHRETEANRFSREMADVLQAAIGKIKNMQIEVEKSCYCFYTPHD